MLWARTVKSPKPAFRNVDVPLATTFMLSSNLAKKLMWNRLIENNGIGLL